MIDFEDLMKTAKTNPSFGEINLVPIPGNYILIRQNNYEVGIISEAGRGTCYIKQIGFFPIDYHETVEKTIIGIVSRIRLSW